MCFQQLMCHGTEHVRDCLLDHVPEDIFEFLAEILLHCYIPGFNEIFSSRQLHQGIEGLLTFQELTPSPSLGCAGGLVAPKLMTNCPTLRFVYLCSACLGMKCDPFG
jgi:hypothetical protein